MQGSSKVNKRSDCLGMPYGHQIWCEEPLSRVQHIARVKCRGGGEPLVFQAGYHPRKRTFKTHP